MKGLTRVLFVWGLAASAAAQTTPDRAAVDRAIDAVYPSLVRIAAVVVDHRDGREVHLEGFGSGTIISPDGYVVTNHHVAGRARRIICTLSDRREMPADLIGTDPLADIAVLKLRPEKPETFPVARFGDSSRLRRGDPVLAMGSPRALSQSVTLGVVSNAEMTMPLQTRLELDGEDVGLIVRWIGHDAAIYPGNSGGPLVNMAGEIVGVNEIGVGLGGAIPSSLARQIAEALIRDRRVSRSWTGFEIQAMAHAAARPGALIGWVASDSPAAAAGVRAGDELVDVNGTPIDVQFAEQLPLANQTLLTLPAAKASTFTIRRDGKTLRITLTPVERPAAASVPAEIRGWGLVVSSLTPFEARTLGRASTDGVRVVSLRPGGPSEQARPGLQRDDVITRVEGRTVRSPSDLEALTREIGGQVRATVMVEIERGNARRLSMVEIAGEQSADMPPAEAKRPWLPLDVQVLTPALAERLGVPGRTGVRVTEVMDAALPLRVGDIILALDDQPIRAAAANDEEIFAAELRRYPIGARVNLRVSRDGAESTVPVTLTDSPALAREMKRYDDQDFGFRVRDLAENDRRDPRFERGAAGVLVDRVDPGSWASLARLTGNDVILAIGGQSVENVDDLAARLREIKARRPATVLLLVQRGVRTLFVEIQPVWR